MRRKRKTRHYETPPIARRVEQVLELPGGTLSAAARIEMTGNRRAVVEGCCGIVEVEEGIIRLNTGSGILRFVGRDLGLSCMTEDSAVVTGFILSVEFMS